MTPFDEYMQEPSLLIWVIRLFLSLGFLFMLSLAFLDPVMKVEGKWCGKCGGWLKEKCPKYDKSSRVSLYLHGLEISAGGGGARSRLYGKEDTRPEHLKPSDYKDPRGKVFDAIYKLGLNRGD